MLISQWTTELIIIGSALALVGGVIGYLIAVSKQSRQLSLLTAQLEQAQQARIAATEQQTLLQGQLKASEAQFHSLQVEQGKLQTQLNAADEAAARHLAELKASNETIASWQSKAEQASQQHHETAKRLENAQTEERNLRAQVSELRERLASAETARSVTQEERDSLKDELAGQETRAQVAESTAAETKAQLAEAKRQVAEHIQAYKGLQAEFDPLSIEHSALKTSLDKSEKQVAELRQRLEQANATCAQLNAERDRLNELLANEGKRAKATEVSEREVREQLQELKGQLAAAAEKHEALQLRLAEVNREYTKLKTELEEREASHARELANFEQQKNSLAEQFKALSNDILEAKIQSLQESSKLSMSAVMTPFQQSIDTFKREVQEIHHRETTQQGELRKELESLKALNQQITTEAHELSTALRGQKKLQGNWGELVLENVLDRSGLQLGKDYQREVSITTEDGRQRPDAVVYLPQGKHLIIDAKVSLNAYTRFVNAEDERERAIALKEHVQAVGSRIKELADRDYYKLPGLNSPDMVFMFIPIESAFVEALKADETLFQQAIENNVLVATPTTLLTSLNIVRQLWRYEDQNKHTAALANKAEAVFKKLNTFLASFEKIKKGLESATDAYVKAEGQLVSGKGNLVKQVGEFKNLAPAIKAELPAYFVDKAALEIDFIPAETNIAALTESDAVQALLAESETDTEYENV